jgi:hypothetical protein
LDNQPEIDLTLTWPIGSLKSATVFTIAEHLLPIIAGVHLVAAVAAVTCVQQQLHLV